VTSGIFYAENFIPILLNHDTHIEHRASKLSIFNFQFSIKNFTFAAESKLNSKMDDGPAKRSDKNNLLSAGMSGLL